MIDGVFALDGDGQIQFAEARALTPGDCATVQQQVRRRVLRWFARAGHLDSADARDMAGRGHGAGFSLDASARSGPSILTEASYSGRSQENGKRAQLTRSAAA